MRFFCGRDSIAQQLPFFDSHRASILSPPNAVRQSHNQASLSVFLWSRFKSHSDLRFDFDYASILSPPNAVRQSHNQASLSVFLWSRFKSHSDLRFDFDYASVLSPPNAVRQSHFRHSGIKFSKNRCEKSNRKFIFEWLFK